MAPGIALAVQANMSLIQFNRTTFTVLDLFLGYVIVFMFMSAPPPQPPTIQQIEENSDLRVVIDWTAGNCAKHDDDVDLWTLAPGAAKPVGYSHKSDHGMALLHDDLGPGGDPDSKCYEKAEAIIARAGEYIVNVHLYRARANGTPPVPVTLVISLKDDKGEWHPILTVIKPLAYEGQELTLARFALDDKKRLIPGSLNDLPAQLRSGS